jgi:hypothetical protein
MSIEWTKFVFFPGQAQPSPVSAEFYTVHTAYHDTRKASPNAVTRPTSIDRALCAMEREMADLFYAGHVGAPLRCAQESAA